MLNLEKKGQLSRDFTISYVLEYVTAGPTEHRYPFIYVVYTFLKGLWGFEF